MYFGKRKDWNRRTVSQGFIQCIALRIANDLVSYHNTSNVVIIYVHI